MLLLVLAQTLVCAPYVSPEIMTERGRLQLTPVTEPLVVRSHGHVEAPGARVSRVLGDVVIVEGARAPGALARDLVTSGAVDEVLAVFETSRGDRLYADRHVRVRFAKEVSSRAALRLIDDAGASKALLVSGQRNEYDVLASSGEAALDVARALHDSGQAVWASPDFIIQARIDVVPNDPFFAVQWHHEILNSTAAWNVTLGSSTTIIAVLDSGTDVSHPDLASKVVFPRDMLELIDGAEPAGNDAHGTACAGIATAFANDGVGVAGVCPGCSLLPIRVLDQSGFTRTSAAADGIRWAVEHGARILSNSWSVSPVPQGLTDAIAEANAAGILLLFASGNAGEALSGDELAANANVRAVGATNRYDLVASYSNYGPQIFVTAPAASVTTDIADNRGYSAGAYYNAFAGTSAATPVVAGLAGLIASARPELTGPQIADILSSTADRIGDAIYSEGRNDYYGAGRVNAYRALLVASQMTPCDPLAEACGNGVDDDCDGLVDNLDPACAPDSPPVGQPCTRDFQCSVDGYCLGAGVGYPDGYCSQGCSGTGGVCPNGTVCLGEGYTTGSSCHVACVDSADCRTGYQCLPVAVGSSTLACVPSCNLSPCLAGEVCNSVTGVCEHDGASPVGGACASRVECADNGRCLSDESGVHGGMCVTECQDSRECASGAICINFGAGTAFCLDNCQVTADCREFYACTPVSDGNGGTLGYCWPACLSASDCGMDKCNEFGLCGDEHPPGETLPVDNDPKDDDDEGCAAVTPELGTLFVALAWVGARRRFRSVA